MKRDPVCKMELYEELAIVYELNGENFYFCSEGCRDKFLIEHPEGSERSTYELIIVGGGPAGLTAAVYAATMKIDTFVLTKDLGGQAFDSTKIENYMGYDFITGPELIQKFKDQLIHSHYVDHLITEVERIELNSNEFEVTTSELRSFTSKALIVATGMRRRKLNLPGEERFQRKGIFYGNIQDYSFVQGKDVAVVGGGNSALQIVEKLHTVADKLHLISEFELTADPLLIERIGAYPKLKRYENTKVIRFLGNGVISGIEIRKKASSDTSILPVRGVFVSIGLEPSSGLVADFVDLNKKREIVVDAQCRTSVPGLFAAGDVTNAFGKRIVIASGEGAKAALSARTHILELREKKRHSIQSG